MDKPSTNEKQFQIEILWADETEPDTYTFKTQAELKGFRLGIAVACGWSKYKIVGEDD